MKEGAAASGSCVGHNQYAFNASRVGAQRSVFKRSNLLLREKEKRESSSNTAALTNTFCEWSFYYFPKSGGEKIRILAKK